MKFSATVFALVAIFGLAAASPQRGEANSNKMQISRPSETLPARTSTRTSKMARGFFPTAKGNALQYLELQFVLIHLGRQSVVTERT
ncbi:hypothetical protein Ct61P_11424 [Colletotrichum tofieldiae]|nr:hypothetical protein Ct61P_11424 [Colletotrichum tofieldiae]